MTHFSLYVSGVLTGSIWWQIQITGRERTDADLNIVLMNMETVGVAPENGGRADLEQRQQVRPLTIRRRIARRCRKIPQAQTVLRDQLFVG